MSGRGWEMKQRFLYTLFVLFLLGQAYHVPAQTMMVAKDGTMQTLVPICLIDSIYATTSGLFLFAEADTLLVCDSLFLNSTLPDTLVIDYQTNHVAVTNPRVKQLNVSVHAHDVTVTSTGKTPFT